MTTLIFWMIVTLRPEWAPGVCDRVFATEANKTYCERRQAAGEEWARSLAGWFVEEGARFDVDPALLVVIAYKEYSLEQGDQCVIRIDATRITSRTMLDEEVDRWEFCWTFGGEGSTRTNCQPALLLRDNEEEGWTEVNRCAYGERGLFQLMSREIPASYELPWGDEIPARLSGRLSAAEDPRTNTHLGARALAEVREKCCGDDEACRADPERWIGCHNTGSCRGDQFRRYGADVARRLVQVRAGACEASPESCPVEEPAPASVVVP